MPKLTEESRKAIFDHVCSIPNIIRTEVDCRVHGLTQNDHDLIPADVRYVQAYASRHAIPIELQAVVVKVAKGEEWLVSTGYSGDSLLFWKHNDRGYTTNVKDAKRWTKEEAIAQANSRSDDTAWPMSALAAGMTTTCNSELVDHNLSYRR